MIHMNQNLCFNFNRAESINKLSEKFKTHTATKSLLAELSDKELDMLSDNPDLVEKIHSICVIDYNNAIIILEEDYDLTIEPYRDGGCWIGVENLEPDTPSWFNSMHVGWSVNGTLELLDFFRRFILQEIRINLWIRYMQNLNKKKEEKKQLGAYGYGLYL